MHYGYDYPPQPLLPRVDAVGRWLGPLGLRLLLALEFFEAGCVKLQGDNWFADVDGKFPLPFSLLSADVNWTMATWLELFASVALLLGLGTRYVAFSLWVLTIVAIEAVHWPTDWSSVSDLCKGFAINDSGFGNYKLPVIYLAMLLPLILSGGGRFSVDHLVATWMARPSVMSSDRSSWGLVLLVLCLPIAALLPWVGGALAASGVVLLMGSAQRRKEMGRHA